MKMKPFILSVMILLIFFNLMFPGAGEGFGKKGDGKDRDGKEGENEQHVFAIQDRIFHCYHEIGTSFGYFPDDDFYHLYPLGLSYTYHFNEHIAWEVARGNIVMSQEKDLREDLEKEFGAKPSRFEKMKYLIHSHLILKPFYGKDAVWNRSIINHEGYCFLGGGMTSYEHRPDASTENVLSLSFGVGLRYFLNRQFSLNVEIRDLVNFREERTENNLGFSLGLGFRFNLSPRKTDDDSPLSSLNRYLKDERKP